MQIETQVPHAFCCEPGLEEHLQYVDRDQVQPATVAAGYQDFGLGWAGLAGRLMEQILKNVFPPPQGP